MENLRVKKIKLLKIKGNRIKSLYIITKTLKKIGKKLKNLEKEENIDACEQGIDIKKLLKIKGKKKRKLYGKRVDSTTQKGKYVKSRLSKDLKNDIAIDATLRAAAMSSDGVINVKSEDLRHKVRKHGAKASLALVVDISGFYVL